MNLCDGPRLVIPSNELYSFRVSELEACEERYGFNTEKTSIDVITCAEVKRL